jgi:hypothetical protein
MEDVLKELMEKFNINDNKYTSKSKNKGNGAGGRNTNKSGKSYEKKVDCSSYLINNGFKIINKDNIIYLYKKLNILKILFFQQRELKKYLIKYYNKKIFRIPDQSILILSKNEKPKLIIIEIKNQNVAGSVDDKLWAGIAIKKNYQYWLETFDVDYVFILSTFLYNLVMGNAKKYNGLFKLLSDSNIKILNGDDINYTNNMYNLITNNLKE